MKFVRFLNCRIDLSKWNFLPRPETEFWVELVLKKLSFQKEAKLLRIQEEAKLLRILDMFSGTGCIGIAVLKNIKNSRVDFVDIDERAIKQIKINLKLNKISLKRYKIYKSDLFKKLAPSRSEGYDRIFANPPYVATERANEVQASVLKYEPKRALFAGKKGLDVIKIFLKQAKKHLNKSGAIFMEFDPQQKKDIEDILDKEGYEKRQFYKDQFKKYRFLKCS